MRRLPRPFRPPIPTGLPGRRWSGISWASPRRLSEKDLERDVERLRLLYRIYGFLEIQVDTVVVRGVEDVHIKFLIQEGEPVRLTRLDILGIDSIPRHDRLERDLPLRTGDPFNRYLLQSTGDTLTARLRELGYPSARVFLLGRTVDSAAREAQVVLRVQAGRQQVIGRIQVEGAPQKDSAFVIKLMAARTGKLYRTSDIFRSQRNIAATESYRFVSVEIDTALYRPEGDSVPLMRPARSRGALSPGCVGGLRHRRLLSRQRFRDSPEHVPAGPAAGGRRASSRKSGPAPRSTSASTRSFSAAGSPTIPSARASSTTPARLPSGSPLSCRRTTCSAFSSSPNGARSSRRISARKSAARSR